MSRTSIESLANRISGGLRVSVHKELLSLSALPRNEGVYAVGSGYPVVPEGYHPAEVPAFGIPYPG